jgi:hypothetical protein
MWYTSADGGQGLGYISSPAIGRHRPSLSTFPLLKPIYNDIERQAIRGIKIEVITIQELVGAKFLALDGVFLKSVPMAEYSNELVNK